MNEESKKLEQNQQEEPMSILQKAIITGFIGGLFWSSVGSLAYYFNFSEVSHASFTLRSFWNANWTNGLFGEMVSIIIIGLLSIGVSFIYYILLRKRPGMLPGILFGVILWVIVLYFLKPIFSAVPTLTEMNITTVITTICLYVLYGTFIGYSISYEYEHLKQAKTTKNKSAQNSG